jgi:HK97 family phage prohead protease
MNQPTLKTEFGDRLSTLSTGQPGLRGTMICEVRAPDATSADPVLDFIASDESIDRYNEVIQINGWDLSHYRRNPVVVDSHDYSSVGKILGRSLSTEIKDGKLVNRVQFALDNPMGKIAYQMAKGGFIRAESVGFIPVEWVRGNESQGEPYRTFTRQELIEISLVPIPANPGAVVELALRSGALQRPDVRALADLLQSLCTTPQNAVAPGHPSSRAEADHGEHWKEVQSQLNEIRAVLGRA